MTLPVIGKTNGLYSMIFFVFLSAFLSWIANLMLGRAFRNSYGKTYAQIIERINGHGMSLAALMFLFVYVLASASSYFIFGKDFFAFFGFFRRFF